MTQPRERRRRWAALILAAAALAGCNSQPDPSDEEATVTTIDASTIPAGLIALRAYNGDGDLLDYDGFVEIQTNGHGEGGFNDTLVDPVTLQVQRMNPIYEGEDGSVVLDRPAGAVALTLAWPTSLGYSTLIIDLPPPGTYDFNLMAAASAVSDGQRRSDDITRFDEAARALDEAVTTSDEPEAAAAADRALDLAVRATLAPDEKPEEARIKGVTIDRVVDDPVVWQSIVAFAGDHEPWARIVFDPGVPAETYRSTVEAAHAEGVKIVGQFLDSSAMADVPLDEFQARVEEYVGAFPDLEEWEVGNEVNGNWLGDDVVAKIRYAAEYVKAQTSARTMLTLYWQLGEDTEQSAMFDWVAANVDRSLADLIDDVSVSMWVEEHPMGVAFDRVFDTLTASFPGKSLTIGELGYGNDDLELIWWWGDEDDPTGAARQSVAETYYPLALTRPGLAGGGFWWYYLDDMFPANDLWKAAAAT